MSQETKNKNEQPKDETVSEQVPEKELPAEEPKENSLQRNTTDTFVWQRNTITSASAARRKRTTYTR